MQITQMLPHLAELASLTFTSVNDLIFRDETKKAWNQMVIETYKKGCMRDERNVCVIFRIPGCPYARDIMEVLELTGMMAWMNSPESFWTLQVLDLQTAVVNGVVNYRWMYGRSERYSAKILMVPGVIYQHPCFQDPQFMFSTVVDREQMEKRMANSVIRIPPQFRWMWVYLLLLCRRWQQVTLRAMESMPCPVFSISSLFPNIPYFETVCGMVPHNKRPYYEMMCQVQHVDDVDVPHDKYLSNSNTLMIRYSFDDHHPIKTRADLIFTPDDAKWFPCRLQEMWAHMFHHYPFIRNTVCAELRNKWLPLFNEFIIESLAHMTMDFLISYDHPTCLFRMDQPNPPGTSAAPSSSPSTWLQHVGIVGLFLVFGVMNNVSSSVMGYVMPIFPSFLLYWTTLIYTILFYVIAWCRNQQPFAIEHRTSRKMYQYYLLGVWTALNGLCFQFSNVWVDGPLQQLLVNMSIPVTFIVNRFYFPKKKYSWKEMVGYTIVVIGIIVGIIPSIRKFNDKSTASNHQSDQWYWVTVFLASVVFAVFQEVQQDYAFDEEMGIKAEKAVTLFWFNLFSLPAYILTIPMESVAYLNGSTNSTSVKDSFVNQQHAFLCYFGTPTADDIASQGCLPYSWLWPNLFCIAYAGYFFLYAVVIGKYGVVFATVLTALVSPLAAGVFASSAIVGSANQKDFDPILGGAFAILFVGVVIKSIPPEWIIPYFPQWCHPYLGGNGSDMAATVVGGAHEGEMSATASTAASAATNEGEITHSNTGINPPSAAESTLNMPLLGTSGSDHQPAAATVVVNRQYSSFSDGNQRYHVLS